MSQVRLLPVGVFHEAQEWNRGYMARLAADRLLYTFRVERRPAGGIGEAAGRLGATGERPAFERAARALCRPLPVSERAALRLDRRRGRESEGRLPGGGDGPVPGAPGRQIPQRLSHDMVGPPLERAAGLGAVLHHPQDHGRHVRHVSARRQPQALQVLEGMAAWADDWTASKTEAHMQQILTIEFGGIAGDAVRSRRGHQQRPLGAGRRPIPEEELHQPTRAPP